jgi:hypothetical protein
VWSSKKIKGTWWAGIVNEYVSVMGYQMKSSGCNDLNLDTFLDCVSIDETKKQRNIVLKQLGLRLDAMVKDIHARIEQHKLRLHPDKAGDKYDPVAWHDLQIAIQFFNAETKRLVRFALLLTFISHVSCWTLCM